MDSGRAMQLFVQYQGAIVYVDVLLPNEDRNIGSAFHVGNGVFVTARHVVEGNRIVGIRATESIPINAKEFFSAHGEDAVSDDLIRKYEETLTPILGRKPLFKHWAAPIEISDGPFYSAKNDLDVAVFKVKAIHSAVPAVPLGIHWDDWVYRVPWQLSDAIVLGYPPIPMVNEPVLVPAKAQIHTYVCPRHAPKIHFILSGIPRGGYSGGVAIHESGDALGVVTASLVSNGKPEELGFMAVLSVEGIVQCLEEFGLYPEFQKNHYESKISLPTLR